MDKGRYRELLAFCRRYDEMRRKGEAGASIVERAARETDAAVAKALIQNTARGMRFEYCECYASRSAFYRARAHFLDRLDALLREESGGLRQ